MPKKTPSLKHIQGQTVPDHDGAASLTMLITPTRVAYAGLLGVTGTRVFGAISVYISGDDQQLFISREESEWQAADVAVIPAYQRHRVRSAAKTVLCLLIEAETIDEAATLQFLSTEPAIAARIRSGFDQIRQYTALDTNRRLFDDLFFGQLLPQRHPDARIAAIVEAIRADPAAPHSAKTCAQFCQLSESRFLHLFTAQAGASFRRFRAWKRARSFLGYVSDRTSVTAVALDAGYPDSTHFSHSIRHFYGFKPTEILAGSRRLTVISQAEDTVKHESATEL